MSRSLQPGAYHSHSRSCSNEQYNYSNELVTRPQTAQYQYSPERVQSVAGSNQADKTSSRARQSAELCYDARRATAELDKIIDDLLSFSSSNGLPPTTLPKSRTTSFDGVRERDNRLHSAHLASHSQRSSGNTATASASATVQDDSIRLGSRTERLSQTQRTTVVERSNQNGGAEHARLGAAAAASSTFQTTTLPPRVSSSYEVQESQTGGEESHSRSQVEESNERRQYQTARVEVYEEVESIALEPIGKGVHDLASSGQSTRPLPRSVSASGPPTGRPSAFLEQDVEVVTLQPIGSGVRDLGQSQNTAPKSVQPRGVPVRTPTAVMYQSQTLNRCYAKRDDPMQRPGTLTTTSISTRADLSPLGSRANESDIPVDNKLLATVRRDSATATRVDQHAAFSTSETETVFEHDSPPLHSSALNGSQASQIADQDCSAIQDDEEIS